MIPRLPSFYHQRIGGIALAYPIPEALDEQRPAQTTRGTHRRLAHMVTCDQSCEHVTATSGTICCECTTARASVARTSDNGLEA